MVYKVTAGRDNILGYYDTRTEAAVIRASQTDPGVRVAIRITQAPRSEMETWQAGQNSGDTAAA
jgi:hypothetical protein